MSGVTAIDDNTPIRVAPVESLRQNWILSRIYIFTPVYFVLNL
jgi:hypothetical protein